ncbi:hypothetical protein QJS10_CPB22g00823 [Acorus calamus]|uniref:Uncharacterized protein n=1 Tax=Acorus calamus TaxID=4465 RepID=A0AAV9C2E4_ACOCL|nr:hypothetical protein QJS10_CPB22g00823 [Acorus calamus]
MNNYESFFRNRRIERERWKPFKSVKVIYEKSRGSFPLSVCHSSHSTPALQFIETETTPLRSTSSSLPTYPSFRSCGASMLLRRSPKRTHRGNGGTEWLYGFWLPFSISPSQIGSLLSCRCLCQSSFGHCQCSASLGPSISSLSWPMRLSLPNE